MPTYTLLGATGGTGSAILRALLASPPKDLTLNILVRNKPKLLQAFPSLEQTTSINVSIFEGSPSDTEVLQSSIKNTDVIFACIATNTPKPGESTTLDTANAIIAGLEKLREEQSSSYKTPSILQLRSASLNPVFVAQYSWLVHSVTFFCLHYIYADLQRATDRLVSAAESASSSTTSSKLLTPIFVDPPAIHDPDGTIPTGYELVLEGKKSDTLSYADLGAAFVEIARRRDEFAGLGVAVGATGKVAENWPPLISNLLVGARARVIGW